MIVSFVLSYFLFPFLYTFIFNEQPYFFSPVLIFPILYGIVGMVVYKSSLKDFVNDLKLGLKVLVPGLVFSLYISGSILYLLTFYWIAIKKNSIEN